MAGLHALQKMLIEHAHPRPASVSPGEFLEIEPDLFAVSVHYNGQDADRMKADLEELGFLRQPHTSAGRIPTDKGYRFYVDFLRNERGVRPYEISSGFVKQFARRLEEVKSDITMMFRIVADENPMG